MSISWDNIEMPFHDKLRSRHHLRLSLYYDQSYQVHIQSISNIAPFSEAQKPGAILEMRWIRCNIGVARLAVQNRFFDRYQDWNLKIWLGESLLLEILRRMQKTVYWYLVALGRSLNSKFCAAKKNYKIQIFKISKTRCKIGEMVQYWRVLYWR